MHFKASNWKHLSMSFYVFQCLTLNFVSGEKEIKLQKRGGAEIIGIATSEKDSGESGTTRSKNNISY